jgi:hypothetical protein
MRKVIKSKTSLARQFYRWLKSVLFYEHWMVGIIEQPIANSLTWTQVPPIHWLASFDSKYYLADPFPWPGSADTLLCEEYNVIERQGHIVALKCDASGIIDRIKIDLPVAGHLSFPFIFMHDGQVYLMPESCIANRLEIFRWLEQNGQWVSHASVFKNKAVADAALFEKDGLFWISYTDVSEDPHDNLNLIYASDLTGPWTPHPLNPVRRGRESSRNAGGLFEVNGKLYRPAQDCSKAYGGAIRIMEVTVCTPKQYLEKEITHITPVSPTYPDGLHTLQAWGDKCLVDGMKVVFSPQLLWRKIRKRMRL